MKTVTLLACRFPSAGAKRIVGDIYGKDERDTVKILYNRGTIHVYPAIESTSIALSKFSCFIRT